MAYNTSTEAALSPLLASRDAVADALYRFILSMDTNDISLFDSAFTQDVAWDLNSRPLQSLDIIHKEVYYFNISKLDTTHFVTNIRINIADGGSEASMSCLYTALHYKMGTGTVMGSPSFATGGLYFMDLVKDEADGLWRMKFFKMKSIWTEGDRAVMGHSKERLMEIENTMASARSNGVDRVNRVNGDHT